MYIYFRDMFDLSNKQGEKVLQGEIDHRVKRKLRICVLVCVGGECVLTVYSIVHKHS